MFPSHDRADNLQLSLLVHLVVLVVVQMLEQEHQVLPLKDIKVEIQIVLEVLAVVEEELVLLVQIILVAMQEMVELV
jgi:hypothetical protein